jgi:hypothetical protein
MQDMRVMPVGTPLWPIYRRPIVAGLAKSDGNPICAGHNAFIRGEDRQEIVCLHHLVQWRGYVKRI